MKSSPLLSLLSLAAAIALAASVSTASAETTPEAAAARSGVEAGAEAAAQAATDEKGAALLEQRNQALEADKAAQEASAAQAPPPAPEPIRELATDELPWLTPSVGEGPRE